MGNAREICRTGSDTSPAEPPALPPRPTVDAAAASPSLMEHRDAGTTPLFSPRMVYDTIIRGLRGRALKTVEGTEWHRVKFIRRGH